MPKPTKKLTPAQKGALTRQINKTEKGIQELLTSIEFEDLKNEVSILKLRIGSDNKDRTPINMALDEAFDRIKLLERSAARNDPQFFAEKFFPVPVVEPAPKTTGQKLDTVFAPKSRTAIPLEFTGLVRANDPAPARRPDFPVKPSDPKEDFFQTDPCQHIGQEPGTWCRQCHGPVPYVPEVYKIKEIKLGVSYPLSKQTPQERLAEEICGKKFCESQQQTLTSGTHTYKVTMRHKDADPAKCPFLGDSAGECWTSVNETLGMNSNDTRRAQLTEAITARSITAAIALVYEQFPELSGSYRVVKVEEA